MDTPLGAESLYTNQSTDPKSPPSEMVGAQGSRAVGSTIKITQMSYADYVLKHGQKTKDLEEDHYVVNGAGHLKEFPDVPFRRRLQDLSGHPQMSRLIHEE